MAEHNELGKEGEEIAVNFLKKQGFFILRRNWTFLKGELDIVAIHDNHLVFVEVKTRRDYYYADTDEVIGAKKLKLLYETADKFYETYKLDLEVRYDLVIVLKHGETWSIEHIPEAFYPFMNT